MFKPCGDTIIVELYVDEESIIHLPDNSKINDEKVYVVKDVGVGYITEHGEIIAPEVKPGDKVIIKGEILKMRVKDDEILLARAQDVVCYEREQVEIPDKV